MPVVALVYEDAVTTLTPAMFRKHQRPEAATGADPPRTPRFSFVTFADSKHVYICSDVKT